MAKQEDIRNTLKRRNAEDGSEGHSFDGALLPKMLRTVYCKQKEIAEKQDLLSSLLKRGTKKISEPSSILQNELTLVAEIIQEVKTELNQIERTFNVHTFQPSASDPPSASDQPLASNIPVTPLEGENEEKSTKYALQHAEQMIRDQRQQLEILKPTERGDAQLVPSNGAIIHHEEHEVTSMSIVVGHKNTTVNNSTVNILNIGEKTVDVENPRLFDILQSLRMAPQPSRNEEPALKQPANEMLSSSRGTTESVQEHSAISLQSKEKPESTSVVQSYTVFEYLSANIGRDWKFVGRELGLRDAKLEQIRHDHSRNTKESIYQMLLCWKQENGSEATYNNLIRALQRVNRTDLADEVLMS